MGRSASGTDAYTGGGADEQPEHSATVSGFKLDQFEVSVGRFRKFVQAYPGSKPAAMAGAHPLIPGSGWQAAWNTSLPADQAALTTALKCSSGYYTWTDSPGANEAVAINCVTWYEALAFCAWDQGRLPTEAEWEFAAAGGDENRLYPWGATPPSATLANFGGSANTPFVRVGSYVLGISRWGQYDLAGGMWEWVLDGHNSSWYAGSGNVCNNCALLTGASRVLRGGDFYNAATHLRAAYRYVSDPAYHGSGIGFRCARTP
jgi:formylglycine-generating enzyme required for sulfatase activity